MDFSQYFGWHNKPEAVESVLAVADNPYFGACSHSVKDSGKGKVQLLYKYVELVLGKFPQLVQEIGDCTSFSAAHGIITVACTEIARNGEYESFDNELVSTEDIYSGSRVLIGNGQLGNGDGSIGAWICEYLQKYGTLKRKKYGNIDLSKYNPNKAREWGRPRVGPPKELLPFAKEHPIKTYSLIKTYEEAIDGIQNGYPILFCSGQGFNTVRDKDGFLKAQGSWPHAMCGVGFDDEYKRPGICLQNSWPMGWVSGPTRHGQSPTSFWVDADVIQRMLNERDSFIISDYNGYPAKDLDWNISKLAKEKAKNYE